MDNWNTLIERLPLLAVCGMSGSGKTTLIEALLPELCAAGLRVTVVKHGARRVEIDRPGKDSDRFFRAGADVCLWGDERFCRRREGEGDTPEAFFSWLARLSRQCDLLLVEGHASTPLAKLWLPGPGFTSPPAGVDRVQAVIPRDRALEWLRAFLADWLPRQWRQAPVWGCVLIGGRSSRMGRPKHLIVQQDRTWLERAVTLLRPQVAQVVLSGAGELPPALADLPRLPDLPGEAAGPLAGLLALMRWNPWVSWLPLACDQPDAGDEALSWLLAQRRPGLWAILPRLEEQGRPEPLLAWYDWRIGAQLEELARQGILRPGALAGQARVATPVVPQALRGAWRNVNRPEELARQRADSGGQSRGGGA